MNRYSGSLKHQRDVNLSHNENQYIPVRMALKLTIPSAGKGQFSFQSQKKVMTKNVQTTTQLHSSHMLAK